MPKTSPFFFKIALAVWLSLCAVCATAQSYEISEHARLAVLVRQLDLLERIAAESQTLPTSQPTTRYHFDYPRLHTDLQRIRSGIYDYLTPQRAQPRDPVEITGQYLRQRADAEKEER